MAKYLTESEVVSLLSEAVEKEGSQSAWANKHGITQAFVSMVLHRKRPPSLPMLVALGVGREVNVRYVKLDETPKLDT